MRRHVALGVLSAALIVRTASAADAVTPGEVRAPYPTLENISLEWAIGGDDDGDATVSVQYGKASGASTREAMPLRRVPAGSNEGFSWENKLAGSIFGLEPGTTYAVVLSLDDPDGGSATELLMVTTRPVPVGPANPREISVTPASIGDALADAAPGDVLLLADGSYDGLVVPNDGSAEQPIVLRAQNPLAAVVEGDVRIDGRSHVMVEDLMVRGKFKFNDAESVVVRGCTIDTPDDGIVSYGSGVNNAVIMHNTIRGPTVWAEASLGVDGDNLGEGVQLTGAGNVVAYNSVSGFRDCLSLLEDDEAVNQVSDDFYGNDLSSCADDAIEADFSMGNVRVYGNRIRDSFMGLSSQPSLGGPTYFVRNVLYNVLYQAFKLQRSSVGDVGLHNTVVKSGDAFSVNSSDVFSHAYFRNNLFIGGPGADYNGYDSGPGDVLMLPSAGPSCSFDYDGFGEVRFDSLSELQGTTSEVHAVEVGLDVFAAAVTFPAEPFAAPATPSLLLAGDGAALDRGLALPNVNDDFAGSAPDLGAFELGALEPTYGPEGGPSTGGGSGTGGSGTGGGGAGGGGAAGEAGSGAGTQGGNGQGGTEGGRGGAGGSAAGSGAGSAEAGRGGSSAGGASGSATGGASSGAGGSGSGGDPSPSGNSVENDGGCSCRVAGRSGAGLAAYALAALALLTASRRRAPARRTATSARAR
jgi:hypothetical protein